jgi:hypothetical protein
MRSMAHLGTGGVGSFGHEFKPNRRLAMWAGCTDSPLVDRLILVGTAPHQLKALGTATDLR